MKKWRTSSTDGVILVEIKPGTEIDTELLLAVSTEYMNHQKGNRALNVVSVAKSSAEVIDLGTFSCQPGVAVPSMAPLGTVEFAVEARLVGASNWGQLLQESPRRTRKRIEITYRAK